MLFKDRVDAGKKLSSLLMHLKDLPEVVAAGLARGGVAVAKEVAEALHVPLNVVVVRKLGAPNNEELAIGAISDTGEKILNDHLIAMLGVSDAYLKAEIQKQKELAAKRSALYHGKCSSSDYNGKMVILVDDGIATGASMRVAIKAIRNSGAKKIILAVPVASPDSLAQLEKEVDGVVCIHAPSFFQAVGSFYRVFDQVTDEEIIKMLSKFNE